MMFIIWQQTSWRIINWLPYSCCDAKGNWTSIFLTHFILLTLNILAVKLASLLWQCPTVLLILLTDLNQMPFNVGTAESSLNFFTTNTCWDFTASITGIVNVSAGTQSLPYHRGRLLDIEVGEHSHIVTWSIQDHFFSTKFILCDQW